MLKLPENPALTAQKLKYPETIWILRVEFLKL